MSDIKVGDVVTYQQPSYTNDKGQRFQPMGLSGCTVVALVGNGAAVLEWQHPFIDDGKPQRFGAELECITKDLTEEENFSGYSDDIGNMVSKL